MDTNNMFLNKEGILDIDEMVVNNASFQKIMEDGEVSEEEIKIQSDKVIKLLQHMESQYTPQQIAEVKTLLAEASVLYSVYNYYLIQNINK